MKTAKVGVATPFGGDRLPSQLATIYFEGIRVLSQRRARYKPHKSEMDIAKMKEPTPTNAAAAPFK